MQETRNGCFERKKHNTTLLQTKIDKYIAAVLLQLSLTYFRSVKDRVTFLLLLLLLLLFEAIVTNFLRLMVLFYKVFIQQ